MKTRIYIIGLLLSLALGQEVLAGHYGFDENYEKTLVKEKIFAFSADKTLKISNQRGSVTIKNWDKPQVSVTVKLVANIKKKRKLDKIIDCAEVVFATDNWSIASKCTREIRLRNESFGFEYTIYAPKNLKIDLETSFGDIAIESISSDSKIEAKFVTLQLNNTVGNAKKPLELHLQFANDVHISYVPNLDIEAKFSTIEIDKVDKIEGKTRFSKLFVADTISSVEISSKHDKINLETVGCLVADEMSFTSLDIEKLLNNLELEGIRFGKVKVDKVAEDFDEITISADFTPIKITLEDLNYDFDLKTKFGNIDIASDVEIREKIKEYNSLYLKGTKKGKGKKGNVKVINKHAKIIIK